MYNSNYSPDKWYWVVAGSTTQVWSSAAAAYVPVVDLTYKAWIAAGNQPTQIDTEFSLNEVLWAQYPAGAPRRPSTVLPLAFLARFTPQELSAISTAALSNGALLMWMMQASAAQTIDLTSSLTSQGLDALVASGMLTATRKVAILTP